MHPTAAQSLFVPRKVPLKRFLLGSLFGHGVLLFGALFFSEMFPSTPLDLNQKPIHASLVRLGKERDQKMLPRKEEPPPPPPKAEEAPPPPKPEPKPEPQPPKVAVPIPGVKPTPPKPPPPKQKGDKDSDSHKKDLFAAFKKVKSTSKEAPEGAANGDVNGTSSVQEGERYYGLLNAQVKRYYDVSDTIPESERLRLNAAVFVKIGAGGQLLDVRLAQKSGNALFDNAVLAAVKRAAPFPPPPEALAKKLRQGIQFSFTPYSS